MGERSLQQAPPINSVRFFDTAVFMKESKEIAILGSGTFGRVALYETPIGKYVIKETKITNRSIGYPSDFLSEIDMLIKLKPIATVVQINGIFFDEFNNKGYMLLEPLDTNLMEWAKQTSFIERMKQLPNIIFFIGSAIAMMHHFSFIHNDIKTNNILVRKDNTTGEYTFKLADFGHSIYTTNPNTCYKGIPEYSPPQKRSICTSEFWSFLVSLIEVILGGKQLVTTEKIIDFYRPYITIRDLYKMRFDLRRYLNSVLTDEEFNMIPSIFWDFVDPLIEGESITIRDCLFRIGISLDINVINEIHKEISKSTKIHPSFHIVKNEFRNRLRNVGLATTHFERFSRLYNKFLSIITENEFLSNLDYKYYAEVAFVIIARSRAEKLQYFKQHDKFLLYQRTFLMKIGYQSIVI